MRIQRDSLNMQIAQLIAKRGTCERGSVGCVITRDGRIIATGYNGSPSGLPHCHDVGCLIKYDKDGGGDSGCKRTLHAEAGVISFASRHGISLMGSTMYVTTSPCVDCANLIINAGIVKVIYLEEYRDSAGLKLLREAEVVVIRHNK